MPGSTTTLGDAAARAGVERARDTYAAGARPAADVIARAATGSLLSAST
ncbi:hypothetical protein [Nonomuraea sp. B1E8]